MADPLVIEIGPVRGRVTAWAARCSACGDLFPLMGHRPSTLKLAYRVAATHGTEEHPGARYVVKGV